MPVLSSLPGEYCGGYANTFMPIPQEWTLDGEGDDDGLLPLRDELNPQTYADFVETWVNAGANAVGGCCGTGPEHIRALRQMLDHLGNQP